MRQRLHLVPFTVTIPTERRDPDLEEKLRHEWPGILKWAIYGCLEYQQKRLNSPFVVRDATAEYFDAQDDFAAWLGECTESRRDYRETAAALFASWRGYAERANIMAGTQRGMGDRLEKAGSTRARTTFARMWTGLRLKASEIVF